MRSRKRSRQAHRDAAGISVREPGGRGRPFLREGRSGVRRFVHDIGGAVRGIFHSDMPEPQVLDGFFKVAGIDGHSGGLGEIRIRSRGAVIEISSAVVRGSRKLRRNEQRPPAALERHVAVGHVRGDGASRAVGIYVVGSVLAGSDRRAPCFAVRCGRNRSTVIVATREDRPVSFLPRIGGSSGSHPSRDFRNGRRRRIDERASEARGIGIFDEPGDRPRHSHGKIARNAHVSRTRDSRHLHVSLGAGLPVRRLFGSVRRSDDRQCRIDRGGLRVIETAECEFFP